MLNVISQTRADHERRIASGYHGRLRGYARLKLRHDPVYAEAAELLLDTDAPVLDIGCGIGLFGLYLRSRGFRGDYLGIDSDATKIARARHGADEHAAALTFEARDAILLPSFCGSVVLLDVLHYLDRERQRGVLRAALRRVAPDGVLIIRTALQEPAWRYYATVCEEHLLYRSGWMRMPARHFPRRDEIESALAGSGMQMTIRPLWGYTPFASFLIVARHPRAT